MAGRQRANGEGSIRERYPGCWEGRYTAGYDILTGKRIQKGVFAKTRKECAAKLARAIQQDTGPYYRKGKGYDSQPLSTWIRLWFDSYTKPNLRPSSADGYRSMIENHIIPVLVLPRWFGFIWSGLFGMGRSDRRGAVTVKKGIYLASVFLFLILLLWLCTVSLVGSTSSPSMYAQF